MEGDFPSSWWCGTCQVQTQWAQGGARTPNSGWAATQGSPGTQVLGSVTLFTSPQAQALECSGGGSAPGRAASWSPGSGGVQAGGLWAGSSQLDHLEQRVLSLPGAPQSYPGRELPPSSSRPPEQGHGERVVSGPAGVTGCGPCRPPPGPSLALPRPQRSYSAGQEGL